jgi:two-component SAPR family response regulator
VETDREQIMDALWPEATVEDAAKQLDRSIHEVRQLLETTQARQHTWQIVHLQLGVVSLAGQSTLWVDAEAFESLVSSVHRVSDHREAEQVLEQATALYTGTYLPQEHTSRASSRREVLRMAWIGAMMELVDLRLARGAWGDAMILLDRLLAIEHANEGAVRRMMNVLAWQRRHGEVRRASNDPYTTIPVIINRERRRTLFPCLCITT